MKKFVISNIILSIALITMLYVFSWVYINYANDGTVKFIEYNKLQDNSVDVVSLGSSHGKYGLKLNEKNQMNLGINSQYFYYDLLILKKYENKIKENGIIILPISIFSFYIDEKKFNEENYRNYINLLEKNKIQRKMKSFEWFLLKNFCVVYPLDKIKTTINYILNKKDKKNYITYWKIEKEEAFYKEAVKTAKRHTLDIKTEYETRGIKLLNDILEYCNKKNYRIVLITTPYWYGYNKELEKIEKNIFRKRIYQNLNKIERIKGKDILYLDYSHDKRFENHIEYFMDDDHLNEKGAEYFTNILLNDLRMRGYKIK